MYDLKPLRSPKIKWRQYKDFVLLDTGHGLNETAALFWRLADGKHTVHDILEEIQKEFSIDRENVERDLEAFIVELIENKLIFFVRNS